MCFFYFHFVILENVLVIMGVHSEEDDSFEGRLTDAFDFALETCSYYAFYIFDRCD